MIKKGGKMTNDKLFDELLSAWEETYKKGQLTLWIFLGLKEGPKCVDEIKVFVEQGSQGSMTCEEQSLYRNLRKFQNLQIVEYQTGKGNKGPDRKYYRLTSMGNRLLEAFIRRNISLFYEENIKNLLTKNN